MVWDGTRISLIAYGKNRVIIMHWVVINSICLTTMQSTIPLRPQAILGVTESAQFWLCGLPEADNFAKLLLKGQNGMSINWIKC